MMAAKRQKKTRQYSKRRVIASDCPFCGSTKTRVWDDNKPNKRTCRCMDCRKTWTQAVPKNPD